MYILTVTVVLMSAIALIAVIFNTKGISIILNFVTYNVRLCACG